MKKVKVIFYFLLTTLYSLLSTPYLVRAYPPGMKAETSEKGRFVGRIANRTQGGILVPDLEVVLEKYVNQNPTEKVKTLTDREGYFQFLDLPVGPQYGYQISLKYQGADYSGHTFSFAQGENLKTMEIGVYDAVDNPGKIKISMKHIFVDIENNVLKISEAVRLENTGNTTYRGQLRFSLPKGFENLQFERGIDSCCSEIKESGFFENTSFYPGMKEVTYSYELKYDSAKYLFLPAVDYPVDNLDLMVRDLGIKAESKKLSFISSIDMGEKKYLRLSAKGILPDEKVEVKISGLPLGPEKYRLYILIFAGLIVLFGIIFPFLRKKPVIISEEKSGESAGVVSQPEEKKNILLREIAELDDRYAAGEIPSREYNKLRTKKKRNLVRLLSHPLISNKTNDNE